MKKLIGFALLLLASGCGKELTEDERARLIANSGPGIHELLNGVTLLCVSEFAWNVSAPIELDKAGYAQRAVTDRTEYNRKAKPAGIRLIRNASRCGGDFMVGSIIPFQNEEPIDRDIANRFIAAFQAYFADPALGFTSVNIETDNDPQATILARADVRANGFEFSYVFGRFGKPAIRRDDRFIRVSRDLVVNVVRVAEPF